MATRKIVPRADNEGGIGTALKQWASGWIKALTVTTINALTLASQAVGFTVAGGTTSKTLTVDETAAMSDKAPKANPQITGILTVVDVNAVFALIGEGITGGGNTTCTITFGGEDVNGDCIAEIQLTGYPGTFMDYCVGRYASQAAVEMRKTASAGTTVAVTGTDGTQMIITISFSATTHPFCIARCAVGGHSSLMQTPPTIVFA